MTTPIAVAITPAGVIVGSGPMPLPGIPAVYTFSGKTAALAAPQIIPIQSVPAQQFNVTLNNQACTIKLYFKQMWIPAASEIPTDPPIMEPVNIGFLDLYLNDALVIGGVRCMDRNLIVRNSYLGLTGDLAFVDTQGFSDPLPTGLGSRFLLTYWSEIE